jgi:hypothetical protein
MFSDLLTRLPAQRKKAEDCTAGSFRLLSEMALRMHAAMTPEDRDRMVELCKRIARETDPTRLSSWIDELKGIIQSKIRELRDTRRVS